jgi:hypothetical protein
MGVSSAYDIEAKRFGGVFLRGVGNEKIATFASPTTGKTGGESKRGSLASQLKPVGSGGQINVVNGYDWTLSNVTDRKDIPYIRLTEYYNTETQIKRQLDYYSRGVIPDTAARAVGGYGGGERMGVLEPYKEIFSKDYPTDFCYWFPYFNKTAFELSTPSWQTLDKLGDSLKNIAGGFGKLTGIDTQGISNTIDALKGASDTALAWQYAGVGTFDRPKIFAGHSERQITVSFPLYNTRSADSYVRNKDLIYLLMSQNLYNKRDYVTGLPPVFYDVYIPGQYYCYAAAMSNINVENLGNVRLLGTRGVIPDAYQVTLTLSELTMPSKNQFEAVTSGEAAKFVNSSTVLQ